MATRLAAAVGGRNEFTLADRLREAGTLHRAGAVADAERAAWTIVAGDKIRLQPSPTAPHERARCHALVAQGYYLLGDYAAAVRLADEALALAPGRGDTLCFRSGALRMLGRLDEAEGDARTAMALAPAAVEPVDMLVAVLLEAGQPERAVTEAEALAERQQSAAAFALLGRALAFVGRPREAIRAFERALKIGTDAPRVLAQMGALCSDIGDHIRAEALYRQALALRPNAAPIAAEFVNALAAAGKDAEAKAALRRFATSLPGYQDRYFDFLFPVRAAAVPEGALDTTRAVLVYPPAEFPAIPLGVALLKAQAESGSGYSVQCLDLNLRLFHDVLDGMRAGRTSVPFADQDALLEAADLFCKGGPGFFDPAAYGRANDTLTRYFGFINDTIRRTCNSAMVSGSPIPWFVMAYARQILETGPKVVGFSIMYTEQLAVAVMLARAVKLLRPDALIVFGGGFFNEKNLAGFLGSNFVDYVCVHEGEAVFRALMDAVNGDGDPREVGGLYWRDPATGEFHETPNSFKLKHNEIPFADVSDLDIGNYFMPEPVMPMISSRGCYWRRCTFCNHFASYASTYKTQSIDRVVAELEHHRTVNGIRHFTFVDEMISAARLKKISEDIIARGLDIYWYALAKPTPDFTGDVFEIMYKSGCRCIYWGLESGSERILQLMDKGNTAESSSQSLKLAAAAGIRNHCFLIVGFPTEKPRDLVDTLELLYDARASVDKLIVNPFVLEKGTPIFDYPDKFGLTKVYDVRSLCNSKYVDFEAPEDTTTQRAELLADRLRIAFFDKFSNRGQSFGTIRDHVIILYGAESERRSVATAVPPVKDVLPLIDLPDDGPVEGTTTVIYPLWNKAAGPAAPQPR